MSDTTELLKLLREIEKRGGPVHLGVWFSGAEHHGLFLLRGKKIPWTLYERHPLPAPFEWLAAGTFIEDLSGPDSDTHLNYVIEDDETGEPGWYVDTFAGSSAAHGRPDGFGTSPAIAAARAWLASHGGER